ncbi:60S ribosomal protein l4 [Phtheirospermum japonicum]|uniref:60S ribosomal protein l4 n=1 Tax=Phtheirospermum japonicum TaxID=374723 RepID=A0A830B278_9LAMI|nr:60S ribosomal protein l4 [Phtheirospermum japonicum]
MATDGGAASSNSQPLPDAMKASICPDLVTFVHGQISNNACQAYAVSKKVGHQTSAKSWGIGRAVSCIPVYPVVVPTALAREPSETFAVAEGCSHPPRPGATCT